jgi:Cys-tRNA(Pro)/Cys-tRNA(Cys) deacylase
MKKNYPTYIDESCMLFNFIYISAGVRGMQIKIDPSDLIELAEMETADLTN